jgi:hypothetical protein
MSVKNVKFLRHAAFPVQRLDRPGVGQADRFLPLRRCWWYFESVQSQKTDEQSKFEHEMNVVQRHQEADRPGSAQTISAGVGLCEGNGA